MESISKSGYLQDFTFQSDLNLMVNQRYLKYRENAQNSQKSFANLNSFGELRFYLIQSSQIHCHKWKSGWSEFNETILIILSKKSRDFREERMIIESTLCKLLALSSLLSWRDYTTGYRIV